MLHKVAGREYVYFGNPHPLVRVLARPESIEKLSEYEAFTPLAPGSRLKAPGKDGVDVSARRPSNAKRSMASRPVARAGVGKRTRPPISPAEQQRLAAAGKLCAGEGLHTLRDIETDKPVQAHGGNVAWNDYRQAWVMISWREWRRVVEPGRDLVRRGAVAAGPLGLRPPRGDARQSFVLQPAATSAAGAGGWPAGFTSRGRTRSCFPA